MLESISEEGKNMDRVRVIRVLEYEGPREWVEACILQRTVKGTKDLGNGCIIREAMVGEDFPVVEEVKKSLDITDREAGFLERFGWELGPDSFIKRDLQTGKVLAHQGDETWDRDLKVAGE